MADKRPNRRARRREGEAAEAPDHAEQRPRQAAEAAPARLSDAELIAGLRGVIEGVERGSEAPPRGKPSRGRPPVVGPPIVERPPIAERPPTRPPPLVDACAQLIELVRKRCPGLLPAGPVRAGTPLDPMPIPTKEISRLVAVAARQAALSAAGGRPNSVESQLPAALLWQDGPAALLVEIGTIGVELGEGLISVAIPVRCDQLPRGREVVTVDFVVGAPGRPAGMLAAATEPRGSRLIVTRWGEALTALAWQALLDAVGGVAAAAGADDDGAVLVPTALAASGDGLSLTAQARHQIDRVRPGSVVLGPEHRGGA